MKSDGLRVALGTSLRQAKVTTGVDMGPAAATEGYALSVEEQEVFMTLDVVTNDMESGPEAQIFNQVNINFLKISVVSNGIYFNQGEDFEWCKVGRHLYEGPKGQVTEYKNNDQRVSKNSQFALAAVFTQLAGKTVEWIADG